MSPRAAWRLEAAGFGPVYDYAAGKADWLAADLPVAGTAQRAGMCTRVGLFWPRAGPPAAGPLQAPARPGRWWSVAGEGAAGLGDPLTGARRPGGRRPG